MENGIFESVRFLNEFNFGNLFKKKEKRPKLDTLTNEDKNLCIDKFKKLLLKHKSGIKKTFNDVIGDNKWPKAIKKYEFVFDLQDVYYSESTEIDGCSSSSGFITMTISRLDLWDIKENLRQAYSDGDPDLDTLIDLEYEYKQAINKYLNDNNIKGIMDNGGDWDDYIHDINVSCDYLKSLDI